VQATRRTTTVTRHEWTLRLPADHTDVGQTLDVAHTARSREPVTAGPITVTAEDDLLVVGYETRESQR